MNELRNKLYGKRLQEEGRKCTVNSLRNQEICKQCIAGRPTHNDLFIYCCLRWTGGDGYLPRDCFYRLEQDITTQGGMSDA